MNPRPFNQARLSRALDLALCLRCVVLFTDPKNEDMLLESFETIVAHMVQFKLLPITTADEIAGSFAPKNDRVCPCCMGYLYPAVLNQLAVQVMQSVQNNLMTLDDIGPSIDLVLDFPKTFDILRIGVRTIITRVPEKTDAFPSFSELFHRLLGKLLRNLGNIKVVEENATKNKVVLSMRLAKEGEICRVLCPYCFDFFKKCGGKDKSVKRSAADMEGTSEQDLFSASNEIVPRRFLDQIVQEHKGMADDSSLAELQSRIKRFYSAREEGQSLTYAITDVCAEKAPVYLLGRYRKLARDVPQSRWDVDAKVPEGNSSGVGSSEKPLDSDTDGNQKGSGDAGLRVRKGRYSVEEIVLDSLAAVIGTDVFNLKMHGCGREDIDVRMLGNGRPFVVECLSLKKDISSAMLDQALRRIAGGFGLNSNHDVEVTWLAEVPRGVWEGMQTVAEEKCKAYCCVVWTETPLSAETLDRKLKAAPLENGAVDEDGVPCLAIEQLTPLRVLHRRSLLNRKRYIYSMNALPLNSNYFLLQIVTSAGTYVKEFVHGDFGRSEPSVSSILGCRADITQLDVTWLYDDFGDLAWSQRAAEAAGRTDSSDDAFASLAVAAIGESVWTSGTTVGAGSKTEALRAVLEAGNEVGWEELREVTRGCQRVSFTKKML